MSLCPCGSGQPYDRCCGPFHRGESAAATAQALMRSRYSAYAVGDAGYVSRTWHPSTRPQRIELGGDAPGWTRLEILGQTGGALFDTEGTVLFEAHFVERGRPGVMRENSRFVREDNVWFYVGPI
jgi:SEC-C motif-containing protein